MDDATHNAAMLASAKTLAEKVGISNDPSWKVALPLIELAVNGGVGINWGAVMKLITDIIAKAPISTIIADIVAIFSS